MSRHGFGRRRTVLQLQDPPQKPATYGLGYKPASEKSKDGSSSIGALDMMAHYEDSEEEEEEEEEEISNPSSSSHPLLSGQKFVASSERLKPPPRPPQPEDVVTSEKTNGRSVSPDTTKPNKAKDEIDSKVLDFLAELETIDVPDTTSGDGIDGDPLTPDESTDGDVSTDDDHDKPKPPVEPTTHWQQCLDEGTQCYYYWHFVTNEVTWEIPAGYSQYLLQIKEYEELLAKHEMDVAQWEKTKSSKPKEKRKKKKLCSLVPYTECGTAEGEVSTYEPPPISTTVPKKSILKPSKDKALLPPQPPLPPQPEQPLGPQLPESTVDSSLLIGPPPPPPEVPDDVHSTISLELPTSSSHLDKLTNQKNSPSDDDSLFGDDMDVDEYIHRKLEEPVFSKYEYVNKKYEGPQPSIMNSKSKTTEVVEEEEDDLEIDIDDIDRELERALERKKAELDTKDVDSLHSKRKAPIDGPANADSTQQNKKHKSDDNAGTSDNQNCPPRMTVSRIHKDDIKRKVCSLAEVTELSSLITDKLDFLEITEKGLSMLQILMIQVETRTQDWKSGGLTTDHFLRSLQEANKQLERYEESAAPTAWSCHWDSKFKRYFYCNNVTEETQWDYPVEDDSADPPIEPSQLDPSYHGDRIPVTTDAASMELAYRSGEMCVSTQGEQYVSRLSSQPAIYDAQLFATPPPPPPDRPSTALLELMSYSDTPEPAQPSSRLVEPGSQGIKPPPPPPEPKLKGPVLPPQSPSVQQHPEPVVTEPVPAGESVRTKPRQSSHRSKHHTSSLKPKLTGPVLPPESKLIGPVLPPESKLIGPVLPPESKLIGPVLPPESKLIGPVLPPESKLIGPVLPPEPKLTGPVLPPEPKLIDPVLSPGMPLIAQVESQPPPPTQMNGAVQPQQPVLAGTPPRSNHKGLGRVTEARATEVVLLPGVTSSTDPLESLSSLEYLAPATDISSALAPKAPVVEPQPPPEPVLSKLAPPQDPLEHRPEPPLPPDSVDLLSAPPLPPSAVDFLSGSTSTVTAGLFVDSEQLTVRPALSPDPGRVLPPHSNHGGPVPPLTVGYIGAPPPPPPPPPEPDSILAVLPPGHAEFDPVPTCPHDPDSYQVLLKPHDGVGEVDLRATYRDVDLDGVAMDEDSRDSCHGEGGTIDTEQFPEVESKKTDSVNICGKAAHFSARPILSHIDGTAAAEEAVTAPARTSHSDEPELLGVSGVYSDLNSDLQSSTLPQPAAVSKPPEHVPEVSTSSTVSTAPPLKEKKKKKKDKSLAGGGLLMKKKNVSGLVQKWQKVQKDVKTEIAKEQKVARAMEEELAALNNS